MSYAVADDKVAELKKFRLDFDGVDVQKRPDRFRRGYHELHLIGYNPRTPEDLSESLEENGYRLMGASPFSLSYCSPDGRTEIYLDEDSVVRSQMCKITVLRGGLTEGELPVAEQEIIALFYDLE